MVLEWPPVTNVKKIGTLTTIELNLLELQYTKDAASFGSEKILQNSTNLNGKKIKTILESKNATTKHNKFRNRFPRLKVFAYGINKIWSLDLA